MHIVVCVKQIINPDTPAHLFQLDPQTKKQIRGSQPLVISIFDEIAVEVALQFRDKDKSATVSALSLGETEAGETLHHAQGMGAGPAFLLSDPAFADLDAFGRAHVLAAALRKIGETTPVDLVLCGQQAGDVELGVTGPYLAEALGWPMVALASNIVPASEGRIRFTRPREGGYAVLEAPLPCVATITNDQSNVPRYPSILGIRKAMKTQLPVWAAADLSLDRNLLAPEAARLNLTAIETARRESHCEFIPGQSAKEKGEHLAQRMRELKLI